MPRAHSAFIARKDVPARKELQAAIKALKYKVTLDDGYVPFETSGYLPCTLDGEDAGFTIRFQDVGEVPAAVKEKLEGRDVEISFKWSGDIREVIAALAVSAALVNDFGAIIYDPDADKVVSKSAFLAKAQETAEEL